MERRRLFNLIGMKGSNVAVSFPDCTTLMNRRSRKQTQARLIKSMLSGNYPMKTLVLTPSVFQRRETGRRKAACSANASSRTEDAKQ